MTRTSRLVSSVLALSLAILPAAAFAQQTTAPVQTTVPDATNAPMVTPETGAAKTPATTPNNQAAKTTAGGTVHANTVQPTDTKAPAHGMKTETHAKEAVGGKDVTAPHANPGTTSHAAPAPAKTAEPSKL